METQIAGADAADLIRSVAVSWSEPALVAVGDGRIEFVNAAAGELCGYAPEALVGRPLKEVLVGPDEMRTSGGETLPVLLSRGACGDRELVLVRDLRPIREHERSLQRQIDEMRRTQALVIQSARLSTLGAMAGGLAHELNTPLSVVRSSSEYLLKKVRTGNEPAELEKFLERILKVAESASEIVRHFLLFSRDEKPEEEIFDLSDVVRGALMLLGERIRVRGIGLKKLLGRRVYVHGTKTRLEQVTVNLINNAIDAMVGVGQRDLTLCTMADDHMAVLRVQDTGCGIRPEDRERIGSPFFSTKATGTGLGLCVSYEIVREHGGTIDIAGRPAHGCVVCVRLPLAKV